MGRLSLKEQPTEERMDSIKKKMEKLASETADAEARIAHFEDIKAANEVEAEKFEEQLKAVQKKIQAMESAYDVTIEDLFNQTVKLEEMEKKAGNAEGDVSGLRSRLILLQGNAEKQEERLAKSTLELAGACIRADGSVRKRIELENGVSSNEETIDNLDKQLSESKITLGDSESKYEDISRKLATLEADAQRGNERAEGAEQEIMDLINKLKRSEYRGEQAEMNIQRLNVRIDQVEEDLLGEKYKIMKISDDLNQTFDDMTNMSV